MRSWLLLVFFVSATVLASLTDCDSTTNESEHDLTSLYESDLSSSSSENSDVEHDLVPTCEIIDPEISCINVSPVTIKMGTAILSLLLFSAVFDNHDLCYEPNAKMIMFSAFVLLAGFGFFEGLHAVVSTNLSNVINEAFSKRKIDWKATGLRFLDLYSSGTKFVNSILGLLILCVKSHPCKSISYPAENLIRVGIYMQLLTTIAMHFFLPKF